MDTQEQNPTQDDQEVPVVEDTETPAVAESPPAEPDAKAE